jgi:MinD-like ATPase involved in chromosome partitioning or flagellar assembly
MENIKQALERVRNGQGEDLHHTDRIGALSSPLSLPGSSVTDAADVLGQEVALNLAHLESNRIIAHDHADPRARAFDMLRTQVLQAMDKKNWRVLGITSPTPGCGKTVVAANLALSIARQPERSAMLLDLDLQRPQVAACLGIQSDGDVTGVLEGRASLTSAVRQARAGSFRTYVLPAQSDAAASSVRMNSRALTMMLQNVRQAYSEAIVVIDLPPMLLGDDVIAVLPQLDCILLVAAVGQTKLSEIEECKKHLASAELIRLVLNKVRGDEAPYKDYYYSHKAADLPGKLAMTEGTAPRPRLSA